MERSRHSWLPGEIDAAVTLAFAAEEVHAQFVSSGGGTRVNRSIGNAQIRIPRPARCIDAGRGEHVRLPDPAFFGMRQAAVDIEIDPFALRRYFKLAIAADIFKIRSNEDFGNVPVPKLIGLNIGARVRLEIELAIWADKQEIKIVLCPAGEHGRSMDRERI